MFDFSTKVEQTFFPVVEDWRHSLRAVIAEELDDLIFLREFAPWGEKTLIKNTTSTEITAAAKNYDFYIPWSFAGLTQDSIYNAMKQGEEQNLYWSESRVYSPEIREWLTKDPLVAFAPESLLDKPGNWHPTRYAGNDPVNFVDPSGYSVIDINRKLGAGPIGDTVRSPYNPLTHTYIATTDFKDGREIIEATYSWGNTGTKEGQRWIKNAPEDLHAAKQALSTGDYRRLGGGEQFESYLEKAMGPRLNDPSHRSNNHTNGWFTLNCKNETYDALNEARTIYRNENNLTPSQDPAYE